MLDPLDPGPITPKSRRFSSVSSRIDHSERSRCVMIDPFGYLPQGSPQRWRWDTRGRAGQFYHLCGDYDQGLLPQHIQWSDIVYCDYKLFDQSLWITEQRSQLEQWLNDQKNMKLLHVSIDEPEASAIELLLSLRGLPWQGDLCLQVYDRTRRGTDPHTVREIRDIFNHEDLWAFDFNRHPVNDQHNDLAWVRDLKDLTVAAVEYTVYRRRSLDK